MLSQHTELAVLFLTRQLQQDNVIRTCVAGLAGGQCQDCDGGQCQPCCCLPQGDSLHSGLCSQGQDDQEQGLHHNLSVCLLECCFCVGQSLCLSVCLIFSSLVLALYADLQLVVVNQHVFVWVLRLL